VGSRWFFADAGHSATGREREEPFMSTSSKTKASIRQGGPGASHENAREPLHIDKPPTDDPQRHHSCVSGGGGEQDSHHTHEPESNGGNTHQASKGKH
jgi:hypothetical protein